MPDKLGEEEIRDLARKRVEAKKGFYIHLTVYLIVNVFLLIIWYMTGRGGDYPWFIWPLAGWGIGLLFHALSVFAFLREGGDWERREIQKEVEKLKKSQGG